LANAALPGGLVSTGGTGFFTGWRGVYCQITLPAGENQDSSGNRPILITRARTYVNARAGYPTATLRLGFGGETSRQLSASFTRAAATTASLTAYQTINAIFGNSDGTLSRRFWIQNSFSDEFIRFAVGASGANTSRSYSINPNTGNPTSESPPVLDTRSSVNQGDGGFAGLAGDFDWFSAPPAPASISASNGTSGSISVSWGASSVSGSVAALDGYTVQVSTSSSFSNPSSYTYNSSTTSASITGLTSGTSYYVRVASRNAVTAAAGTTSVWRTLSGTVTAGPPPQPTGLTVGTRTTTSIQLSWTAVSGVSGYELFLGDKAVTTTTGTTYTFLTLTAGTSYVLGVTSYVGSGTTKASSSKATINASTIGNPTYAADAAYPVAKIDLQYAASVTAANATSYALGYGSLPPGLELKPNGTIEGRPQQRPGTFHSDTSPAYLDSFTFGVTATGETGSTATTKQFVITTVFPGERLVSPVSRDLIIAKKYDGQAWVPIQRARKFNGSTWVEISQT